jgi:hypothetical protein
MLFIDDIFIFLEVTQTMSELFNPTSWGSPGGVGFFLVCLGIFLYLLGRTGGKSDKNKNSTKD